MTAPGGAWRPLRPPVLVVQPLPGIGDKFVTAIGPIATGPSGHVGVRVGLDGPHAGPHDQGLWILNPDHSFRPVMQTGTPLVIRGHGAFPAIDFTFQESGDITGNARSVMPQPINARGDFAFLVRTDGFDQVLAVAPASALCDVDFNEDGFLDFSDFDDFVNAFESGC